MRPTKMHQGSMTRRSSAVAGAVALAIAAVALFAPVRADAQVAPTTDLGITLVSPSHTIEAGGTVLVPLRGAHLGGAIPTDGVMRVVVPAGVEVVTGWVGWWRRPCTITAQAATCTLSTSPAGWVGEVELRVDHGGFYPLTVSIESPGSTDTDPTNNQATLNLRVSSPETADLILHGSVTPPTVAVGDQVVQHLDTYNTAGTTATDVEIRTSVPEGFTLVSAKVGWFARPCTVTGRDVTCRISSLAVGANNFAVVTLTADQAGTSTITATVDAANPDEDLTRNTVTSDVTVLPTATTDLRIEATPPTSTGEIGSTFSIWVTSRHLSGVWPSDTTLTFDVPPGLEIVNALAGTYSRPCTVAGRTITCQPGGPPVNWFAFAELRAIAPGAHVVTTTVSTATATDTNPTNNTASAAIGISSPATADLSVDQLIVTPVSTGAQVPQRIVARNAGPATATSVVLTTTVPEGFTLVSAVVGYFGRPCTVAGDVVTCTIASIPAGASNAATITLLAEGPGTFDLGANVSSAVTDPRPVDNQDSTQLVVTA